MLPALVEAEYGSVQTDLDAREISSLLCLAALLDASDVQAFAFPDEWFTGTRVQDPVLGNTFVYEADAALLRDFVRQFQEGTLLAPAPSLISTPSP